MAKIICQQKIPINKLKLWDKNPRAIKKEDYQRLKNQIINLGIYSPLVVNENNIVLSGNMRLRVFRELNINPVWCTIVETKDESEMIKYALSANDRSGYYEMEALDQLVNEFPGQIDHKEFSADFSPPMTLDFTLSNPPQNPEEEKKDEKKSGGSRECPECGYVF